MTDRMIKSFADLHACVESYEHKTVIYRGVTDVSYELIPDVGRYEDFKAATIEKGEN